MISGYVDLASCKWAERIGRRIPPMIEITTVELKINDIIGVLRQARNNSYFVDYSYAAMPLKKCLKMRMKTLEKFKKMGIGLLGINDSVKVIIAANKNDVSCYSPSICKRLWNFKIRHKIA